MRSLSRIALWGALGWLVAPVVAALWVVAVMVGFDLADRLVHRLDRVIDWLEA